MQVDPAKDYFAVLGVSPEADPTVVKAAYRALAKKYHPDRHPNADEHVTLKFHELQEAYDLINDEHRLKTYLRLRSRAQHKKADFYARQHRPSVHLQLDDRWDHLIREYPKLGQHHARFCFMSQKLGRDFKLIVLGTLKPAKFDKIARRMERKFYRQHFSLHRDVQRLASRLALRRRRHAVRQLWREINGRRLLPRRYRRSLLERYESRYLRPCVTNPFGFKPQHLSLPRSHSSKPDQSTERASRRPVGPWIAALFGMGLSGH